MIVPELPALPSHCGKNTWIGENGEELSVPTETADHFLV
jgi:hypothetical protein